MEKGIKAEKDDSDSNSEKSNPDFSDQISEWLSKGDYNVSKISNLLFDPAKPGSISESLVLTDPPKEKERPIGIGRVKFLISVKKTKERVSAILWFGDDEEEWNLYFFQKEDLSHMYTLADALTIRFGRRVKVKFLDLSKEEYNPKSTLKETLRKIKLRRRAKVKFTKQE